MGGLKTRDPIIAVTPEGKRIFGYNDKGTPICYSRKSLGGRCHSIATMPNGRCTIHGGKAPAGITHWNAQHLRTSNNLPGHLQGDMNRALSDPDQLNLKHEIALVDTLIAKQKEALETGLGAEAYKVLLKLSYSLEDALENDPEQSEKICEKLISTIRQGVKEREVWEEIKVSVEARRKVVETAHKREVALKLLLKADQVVALVTSIASVCKTEIVKFMANLEKDFILIPREKATMTFKSAVEGIAVEHLPPHYRTDFLSDIGVHLGKLIGDVKSVPTPTPSDPVHPDYKVNNVSPVHVPKYRGKKGPGRVYRIPEEGDTF